MNYQVDHLTTFTYTSPVIAAHHVMRLKPRFVTDRQTVMRHGLEVSSDHAETHEFLDCFGNETYELRLNARHSELHIRSISQVNVTPGDDVLLDLSPSWEQVAEALSAPASPAQWEAAQFCFPSNHVAPDTVGEEFDVLFSPGKPVLRLALDLTEYIYREFNYQQGSTDVQTTNAQVVAQRSGVCQDFAHLALAVMRRFGLAARYVSGYILSNTDPQSDLVGSEASHAWLSVYSPEIGWLDYDPTNNQMTSNQHITLAWGRDYADVAPTRGALLGGGAQTIDVAVSVTPV